jgi:hypothetical protein
VTVGVYSQRLANAEIQITKLEDQVVTRSDIKGIRNAIDGIQITLDNHRQDQYLILVEIEKRLAKIEAIQEVQKRTR